MPQTTLSPLPEIYPKASSFRVITCGDPTCQAVHILSNAANGDALADTTMSIAQLEKVLEYAREAVP